MSSRPAPAWLAELQARFGAMIRTPLDRSSGTLTATPAAYDPALSAEARDGPNATAKDRLALYNRQYWFRLFGVMHAAFPLTTRLLGHWRLNDYAARFLLAHPPHGWDVEQASQGFEGFLAELCETEAPPTESLALIEAAEIDAAHRRVFRAPPSVPFRPSAAEAVELMASRLVPSPACAWVEEHWPLLELRRRALQEPGEAPWPLPPRLPRAQAWLIVRTPAGIGQLPLEPREAELFTLLRQLPVTEALARLERGTDPDERAALPVRARAWLARSMQLEVWSGIAPASSLTRR